VPGGRDLLTALGRVRPMLDPGSLYFYDLLQVLRSL